MKLKSLFILVLAIAIGGLIYYTNAKPREDLLGDNSFLLPGLAKVLNDVTKLTVTESGNTALTIISKSDNNWVVENRDGYEANMAAVRTVFNKLAEAKLIEAKTSNPENYSKLGVEDVKNSTAQGVEFSIEGLSEPINIIAGNDGSASKSTQYIRRAGEEQSWLINKKLNLNRDVTQWLRTDILDIAPERIKSIQIAHLDGSEISIENKGTEEYEFTLTNTLPEGKKVSESEIYQVANALSSMQLRDVASLERLHEDLVQPTITTFVTYDGLTITAKTFTEEQEAYSTIEIEFNADQVDSSRHVEAEQSDPAMKFDPKAAEELAQKTAPRLKDWAYVLPTITHNALVKKLEDFFLDEDA
ncbi:MAG: DUF4340 domain-containing protein [Gammaproteobacteria bacterium]|nr:DUF4340 domain-containing protein [Gammaproteobacteria bacterium]